MKTLDHWFAHVATLAGAWTGHPLAFVLSCVAVIVWAVTGPIFGFSDTWQLVINTGTTVITYLLIFLVQNTQNRNAAAMHLKLDEIIRALPQARTELVMHHLETASEQELATFKAELDRLATRSKQPRQS
ncbi:MAG TPA: low affinity iron permease family protein [Chloroflexota bacterium]